MYLLSLLVCFLATVSCVLPQLERLENLAIHYGLAKFVTYDSAENFYARRINTIHQCEYENCLGLTQNARCDENWCLFEMGPFDMNAGGYIEGRARDFFPLWKLRSHKPTEPLSLKTTFSGPIDEYGNVIPFPPIHTHHNAVRIGECHWNTYGDTECPDLEPKSATSCMFLHYSNTTCHVADNLEHFNSIPTYIDLLFNDVRPVHYPPIRFWYRIAVEIEQKRNMRPVSIFRLFSLGNQRVQSRYTLVLPLPPQTETIWYGTFQLNVNGVLVPELCATHSHQLYYTNAYLLRRSHTIFTNIQTRSPCEPILPNTTQFHTNANASKYISTHFTNDIICTASSNIKVIDGKGYDRMSTVNCLQERFAKDDVWLSVFFNKNPLSTTGPAHNFWYLRYINDESVFHNTIYSGTNFTNINGTEDCDPYHQAIVSKSISQKL
jgi:hypothetical protein